MVVDVRPISQLLTWRTFFDSFSGVMRIRSAEPFVLLQERRNLYPLHINPYAPAKVIVDLSQCLSGEYSCLFSEQKPMITTIVSRPTRADPRSPLSSIQPTLKYSLIPQGIHCTGRNDLTTP